LRPVFIDTKARRYIKKFHHAFYINNIEMFWGSSISGGNNIDVYTKELNDEILVGYKTEWHKAIRHLFIVIGFMLLFLPAYVVFSEIVLR
jgi:hypothetical protein